MHDLLIEMHLAEAIVEKQGGELIRRQVLRDELFDDVLAQHDLDRATFFESYQYYLAKPDILDVLYEGIVDSLASRLTLEEKRIRERPKKKVPPKKR